MFNVNIEIDFIWLDERKFLTVSRYELVHTAHSKYSVVGNFLIEKGFHS